MKFIYSLIIVLIFFVGCTANKDMEVSSKNYSNITKDQLLHAMKKVLLYADKDNVDNFRIDTYNTEINATRAKFAYKAVTMNLIVDKFYFYVTSDVNNTIKGNLVISKSYGVDEEDTEYIESDDLIYDMVWDRIDYLLGLKDKWVDCLSYEGDIDKIKVISNQEFLCDSIDLDNYRPKEEDKVAIEKVIIVEEKPSHGYDLSYLNDIKYDIDYLLSDLNDINIDLVDDNKTLKEK